LLVPRKVGLDTDVTEHLADNGQAAFSPEVVLKRIILKARKGDTLERFASKNGVSVANLMSWNKLSANAPLKAGQSIVLLIPTTQGRYMAKGLHNKPHQAQTASNTSKAKSQPVKTGKHASHSAKPQGKVVIAARK